MVEISLWVNLKVFVMKVEHRKVIILGRFLYSFLYTCVTPHKYAANLSLCYSSEEKMRLFE